MISIPVEYHLKTLYRLIVFMFLLVILVNLGAMQDDVNEIKDKVNAISTTTTTVSTTTTTTFKGILCHVNGYVVNTDLESAKAAGCK